MPHNNHWSNVSVVVLCKDKTTEQICKLVRHLLLCSISYTRESKHIMALQGPVHIFTQPLLACNFLVNYICRPVINIHCCNIDTMIRQL